MAATQGNASQPNVHAVPFVWVVPSLSALDAVNPAEGTVFSCAVVRAGTERRDSRPVLAVFDNKLAADEESQPRQTAA